MSYMITRTPEQFLILALVLVISFLSAGCQRAYYGTMEKLGYHKRDLLVDRVKDARDSQKEAKEQFESALEKFSAVLDFQGGSLEKKYEQLKAEFEKSEERAEEVRDRMESVEDVSEALFREWKSELKEYTNPSLRRSSERKLRQTQKQYAHLIDAMKRAEKRINPVLSALRDQVLFLKHNLNAQAIASLQGELSSVESEVAALIQEMETSISEADQFLRAMAKD